LPTFHAVQLDSDDALETKKQNWVDSAILRFEAVLSASGDMAKQILRQESASRAMSKKKFLPDERTTMVTGEEEDKILRRAFEYIVALMEFNLVTLKFQLNHYLFIGFKKELSKTFRNKLTEETDWADLVKPDPHLAKRLDEVKKRIIGVKASLEEVERLQRRPM